MKLKLIKISVLVGVIYALISSPQAEARTFVAGEAELAYVNFDAKADDRLTGKQSRYKGDSFAQKYAVTWSASNLLYRQQQQYYDISLGYDWLNFDTKTSNGISDTRIKDVFGKLRYSGDIGYNPVNIPISLRIYANDARPVTLSRGSGSSGLIGEGFFRSINGKTRNEAFGVSFTFDPDQARSVALRGLPRLQLDYRESFNKSLTNDYLMDSSTKELAVAGLSKQNNWVHFKTLSYEDHLDKNNNFEQQQFQIGHVDYRGRRLWSSLTNWIEVSADGQLTTRRAAENFEEYDVNFMSIATRRTWNARTFMNYNRKMTTYSALSDSKLIESARIPLYIKGIYGSETNWFMSVSAERGTRTTFSPLTLTSNKLPSYSSTISVGATTFNRSLFTLSPSVSVSTNKGYGGGDSLDFRAAVETNSTARYSSKVGLSARSQFRYLDDGANLSTSKSWAQTVSLKAIYKPDSKFIYRLNEDLEIGDAAPIMYTSAGNSGTEQYLNSMTTASISWNPNAAFSSSLEAYHNKRSYEFNAGTSETQLSHRLSYDRQQTFYKLDTRYTQKNYIDLNSSEFDHMGNFQYRPDRYNVATLRYRYNKNDYNSYSYSKIDLLERYSYNFFTRTGVVRNFATLSQEIGFTGEESNGNKNYLHYLLISGRYSPTERLSLYGSGKYESGNLGSTTFYYNAGLNADFKLLSTSLDYALAKRDSDNRIEKRFSATVRRTF